MTCPDCKPPSPLEPIMKSLKKIEGSLFWISISIFILFLSVMGVTETVSMIHHNVKNVSSDFRQLLSQTRERDDADASSESN